MTEADHDLIARLSAENEEAIRIWTEQHKGEPCKYCDATEGLECHPVGSLGRLTLLCPVCKDRLSAATKAYWEGYSAGCAAGARDFKRLPWYSRLWC